MNVAFLIHAIEASSVGHGCILARGVDDGLLLCFKCSPARCSQLGIVSGWRLNTSGLEEGVLDERSGRIGVDKLRIIRVERDQGSRKLEELRTLSNEIETHSALGGWSVLAFVVLKRSGFAEISKLSDLIAQELQEDCGCLVQGSLDVGEAGAWERGALLGVQSVIDGRQDEVDLASEEGLVECGNDLILKGIQLRKEVTRSRRGVDVDEHPAALGITRGQRGIIGKFSHRTVAELLGHFESNLLRAFTNCLLIIELRVDVSKCCLNSRCGLRCAGTTIDVDATLDLANEKIINEGSIELNLFDCCRRVHVLKEGETSREGQGVARKI